MGDVFEFLGCHLRGFMGLEKKRLSVQTASFFSQLLIPVYHHDLLPHQTFFGSHLQNVNSCRIITC
jgi:hypothetical protein